MSAMGFCCYLPISDRITEQTSDLFHQLPYAVEALAAPYIHKHYHPPPGTIKKKFVQSNHQRSRIWLGHFAHTSRHPLLLTPTCMVLCVTALSMTIKCSQSRYGLQILERYYAYGPSPKPTMDQTIHLVDSLSILQENLHALAYQGTQWIRMNKHNFCSGLLLPAVASSPAPTAPCG